MTLAFPATVSPWLTFGVQSITGVTTIVVAIIVARISKQNAETAQEKLRLDLYDLRYAVYKEVRDFQVDLLLWSGDAAQTKRSIAFPELSERAKFLFPPQSCVASYLTDMHKHAYFIVRYQSTFDAYAGMLEEQVKLANERTEHVGWLTTSLPELAKRMGPYLNFHSI